MTQEYVLGKLLTKAFDQRTPLVGSLEINTTCNFNCIHCYLMGKHDLIMQYPDVIRILDEMKRVGTLFLNLTGGEIFAHPEFERIYSYAVSKGFIVSLLTNASMLTPQIRNLLKAKPPRKIEITIYGISQEVFKKVTCSDSNPDMILENIVSLKEDGHNILLKMMTLKENQLEFNLVKVFADKYTIPFQYDISLLPTLSGDQKVLQHQLSVDEAIALELSDGTNRLARWKSMVESYDVAQNKKINCGCGKFSYAISADMQLKRCNFIAGGSDAFSLKQYSFNEIWNKWNMEKPNLFSYEHCKKCMYQALCDVCPSGSYTLGSEKDGRVQRQCDLAKARYEVVKRYEDSCN